MEAKRKISLLVSQTEAKRKRNGFCFALFRFEAKKNKKRKWDTLMPILHHLTNFLPSQRTGEVPRQPGEGPRGHQPHQQDLLHAGERVSLGCLSISEEAKVIDSSP